ncbi:hypothetical protein NE865_05329 [Phthorimaea operculella]|nr:hypothetical protein NE865_05329 [Phthorimaea operculella]
MDARFLMVPATLACSMAFHMPVGTPPNAIVAGVAHIPTAKMAFGGIGPKIITTLIVWGAYPTWGRLIFRDQMKPYRNATDLISNSTNLISNSTDLSAPLKLACHTTVGMFNSSSPVNCIYNNTVPALLDGFFRCNYTAK